jgi:hypothetical protein
MSIASFSMNWRTDHARVSECRRSAAVARDALLRAGEEPPLASHLVIHRGLYTHHGIYIGHDSVIHYAGLKHGLRRGPVEEVSLACFARGRGIRVRQGPSGFGCREVVERARSRLGESRYQLLTNNCEHLCMWALTGESRSMQIERLRSWSGAVRHALFTLIGLGVRPCRRLMARAAAGWTLPAIEVRAAEVVSLINSVGRRNLGTAVGQTNRPGAPACVGADDRRRRVGGAVFAPCQHQCGTATP